MIYILNPGDFCDVERFSNARDAMNARAQSNAGARLIRYNPSPNAAHKWHEYDFGTGWFPVERMNLQVKVIAAAQAL